MDQETHWFRYAFPAASHQQQRRRRRPQEREKENRCNTDSVYGGQGWTERAAWKRERERVRITKAAISVGMCVYELGLEPTPPSPFLFLFPSLSHTHSLILSFPSLLHFLTSLMNDFSWSLGDLKRPLNRCTLTSFAEQSHYSFEIYSPLSFTKQISLILLSCLSLD